LAFLPFFFFAIGPALSYVSRQAQHFCPRGVAAPGQPEIAVARRSATAGGGAAIPAAKRAARRLPRAWR
jgi:hypothetical protein